MEDDDFDNGIDGTPWEENDQFDEIIAQVYEDGGTLIHYDQTIDLMVAYFSGQWNDSGVDPDRICISLNSHTSMEDDHYWVGIYENSVHFNSPSKKYFEIEAKVKLSDFIDITSPVSIELYKTHFPDLIDAISNKQIKVNFDKQKFIDRIKRFENLLVFG